MTLYQINLALLCIVIVGIPFTAAWYMVVGSIYRDSNK